MVNNNYPVDIPKTYTVSYFNENEWNKGLTPEEKVKNSEVAELQYQDNLLNGPQVGPGNENSTMVVKKIASVALAASYFTPLAAVTIPASVGAGVASAGLMAHGLITDDEDTGKAGAHMAEVLFDAVNPTGDSNGQGKFAVSYVEYQRNK